MTLVLMNGRSCKSRTVWCYASNTDSDSAAKCMHSNARDGPRQASEGIDTDTETGTETRDGGCCPLSLVFFFFFRLAIIIIIINTGNGADETRLSRCRCNAATKITIADTWTASMGGWPECGLSVTPDNGDRRPGSLVVASPMVQRMQRRLPLAAACPVLSLLRSLRFLSCPVPSL